MTLSILRLHMLIASQEPQPVICFPKVAETWRPFREMYILAVLGLGSLSLLAACLLQYFGAYYINLAAGFGITFIFLSIYAGAVCLKSKKKPSHSIAFCLLWGILEGVGGSACAFLIDMLVPVFHVPFVIFIFYAALLAVLAVLIEAYFCLMQGGAVKG